jgi:hypothetical protein
MSEDEEDVDALLGGGGVVHMICQRMKKMWIALLGGGGVVHDMSDEVNAK